MQTADLIQNVFAMALTSPSFPRAAYRYSNRGHLIIHHTDRAELVSWIVPLLALARYAAAGFAVAVAFLVFGVTRVLPEPAPVTLGARIMLFPGTAALWPYVLIRWLRSSR